MDSGQLRRALSIAEFVGAGLLLLLGVTALATKPAPRADFGDWGRAFDFVCVGLGVTMAWAAKGAWVGADGWPRRQVMLVAAVPVAFVVLVLAMLL